MVKKLMFTILPPSAAIVIFLLRDYISVIASRAPECIFRKYTGLLCPGCGNTHAVLSMLSLDFISAIKYNITIPLLTLAAVLFYAEFVITAWIRPVKIMPRGFRLYMGIIILLIIYFVLRNVI